MKEYIYSASNNSFFKISELYLYERWDLADGVEVEESMFDEFTQDRSGAGLVRVAGNDGFPAWAEMPPRTEDELEADAVSQKNALIAYATQIIDPLKDALDGGYIDDEDKPKLAAWQKYRYALTKVDAANPTWPAVPAE